MERSSRESESELPHDVFLSHASMDKQQYIEPLANALDDHRVSYWLDAQQIAWGDSIFGQINAGLRSSRFAVICLSEHFLARPWPENELGAALAMQNQDGKKRVLPLILNSKETVLKEYPLLAGLDYREYSHGPGSIADELAGLVGEATKASASDELYVVIESIYTGRLKNLRVSPRATLGWLITQAMTGLGLRDVADAGAPRGFPIRWALVDARAESSWRKKPRSQQRKIMAMIETQNGVKISKSLDDRVGDFGIYDRMVCHLYAFEDESRLTGGGGGGWGFGGAAYR